MTEASYPENDKKKKSENIPLRMSVTGKPIKIRVTDYTERKRRRW